MRRKQILIIDARPLCREGLKSVLNLTLDAIDFTDAGSDYAFVQGLRQQKEFDLILVHESFLSIGDHGLILSHLYKTQNPIAVICDQVSEKLQVKLKFFNISGVIQQTEPVDIIAKRIADLLTGVDSGLNRSRSISPYPTGFSAPHLPLEDVGVKTKLDYLTGRQRDVLDYLKVGLMNKEIAFEMGICESTVKRHVSDIFKKLRVQNRTQLAVSLSY